MSSTDVSDEDMASSSSESSEEPSEYEADGLSSAESLSGAESSVSSESAAAAAANADPDACDPNLVCDVCRTGGSAELLLLCDACNSGVHTFCLRPRLSDVPPGKWSCPACTAKYPKGYMYELLDHLLGSHRTMAHRERLRHYKGRQHEPLDDDAAAARDDETHTWIRENLSAELVNTAKKEMRESAHRRRRNRRTGEGNPQAAPQGAGRPTQRPAANDGKRQRLQARLRDLRKDVWKDNSAESPEELSGGESPEETQPRSTGNNPGSSSGHAAALGQPDAGPETHAMDDEQSDEAAALGQLEADAPHAPGGQPFSNEASTDCGLPDRLSDVHAVVYVCEATGNDVTLVTKVVVADKTVVGRNPQSDLRLDNIELPMPRETGLQNFCVSVCRLEHSTPSCL